MILRYHLYILLGALLHGSIVVFGRWFHRAGFSLYEISLLIGFTAVPLAPLIILIRELRPSMRSLPAYLAFGLVGALLQMAQYSGVIFGLPLAVVAILLYSQPIWTTFLSRLFLGEVLTVRKALAAILGLGGILILVDVSRLSAGDSFDIRGIAGALAAGILLSLWVIQGRRRTLGRENFITITFGYSLFSGLWLLILHLPLSWIFPQRELTRLDVETYWCAWPTVIAFILLVGILPHFMILSGMRQVEAMVTGLLMLFEPIGAALLAFWMFDEGLTWRLIGSGGLILLANMVILAEKKGGSQASDQSGTRELEQ